MLKSLKQKFNKNFTSTETLKEQNIENESISKTDDMWRIGIICKKDCYYITTEILRCLERNGYEWKIISSSYKIKCRRKNIDQKENSNRYSNLNVLIQIFSVKNKSYINIEHRQ